MEFMNEVVTKVKKRNKVGSIYHTYDLDQFKDLTGNRVVNVPNVKRIVSSVSDNGLLMTVVVVNENMEVIDGQHRIDAAKEHGLGVYYSIVNGYGLQEVQALNAVGKKWSQKDVLYSYCTLGNDNYIRLRKLYERYGYPLQSILMAAYNVSGFHMNKPAKNGKIGNQGIDFNKGGMILTAEQYNRAVNFFEKYSRLKSICDFHDHAIFVGAVVFLKKEFSYFDLDKFTDKCFKFPTMLVKPANRAQAYDLIEKIYNYKNQNKVSLRPL